MNNIKMVAMSVYEVSVKDVDKASLVMAACEKRLSKFITQREKVLLP
jgi:hypothetical protein